MSIVSARDLVLDTALIRKYDTFGPRYTSYPTADRFHDGFTAESYVNALAARNHGRAQQPLSLYVHLPFCNTICFYCACNKVVTKDHGRSARYIRYLGREIGIVSGAGRRRAAGRAAALGRRHADVPVARRRWRS